MTILAIAALAASGTVWAMMRCPLGRAISLSVDRFAEAAHAEPGALD